MSLLFFLCLWQRNVKLFFFFILGNECKETLGSGAQPGLPHYSIRSCPVNGVVLGCWLFAGVPAMVRKESQGRGAATLSGPLREEMADAPSQPCNSAQTSLWVMSLTSLGPAAASSRHARNASGNRKLYFQAFVGGEKCLCWGCFSAGGPWETVTGSQVPRLGSGAPGE